MRSPGWNPFLIGQNEHLHASCCSQCLVEQRNSRAAAVLLLKEKRMEAANEASSRKRWKEESESRRRAKHDRHRKGCFSRDTQGQHDKASSTAVSSEWRSMACACSWLLIAGRCCRLLAALQQQALLSWRGCALFRSGRCLGARIWCLVVVWLFSLKTIVSLLVWFLFRCISTTKKTRWLLDGMSGKTGCHRGGDC